MSGVNSGSKQGLGRGLGALLGERVEEKRPDDALKELSLHEIVPCASQPRKYFSEEQLKELAASIQEKGIVQPLVVRPMRDGRYEIVAGERRWRAAKMLSLETVPAVVRTYTDADAMTIALIENIQRENLNPMEEAEAFSLLKEKFKLSQEELAKSLGKSRSGLANSLRLLNLPKEMRDLIFETKLSAAHGRTLLALHNQELQTELAGRIINNNLSVRDAENIVEYANAYHKLPELPEIAEHTKNDEKEELAQENADKKPTPRRRLAEKSQVFKSLQKHLRDQIHRGTTISGTLENGKIVLPFSGQAELEHLLHLLSLAPELFNLDTEINDSTDAGETI